MGLSKMKAITRNEYGLSKVLELKEVEVPKIKENEVLVRVYATTVNRTDCAILLGKPFIMRFFTGLFKPNKEITGTDFAGEVVKIGKNIKNFKVGNKVFGFDDNGLESHAEFMAISEDKPFDIMPKNLSFDEAVASLEGAHYAYNFINKVSINRGDTILVNGASGAIGVSTVQFSKYLGGCVTAVCNTKNIELIKSLGANKIIDYTKEDFTKDNEKYNYIFDTVGKSSFAKCKHLLEKKGVYISSELGYMAQNPILALITKIIGDKKVKFPAPTDIKGSIRFIKKLIEIDKYKPVIDKKYPLEKINQAYDYVAMGQKTGNVIIKL